MSLPLIRDDPWLSDILGRSAFRVDVSAGDASGRAPAASRRGALDEHAGRQTAAFYYAKVDTARVDDVRDLGAAGFYVVDVNVVLAREAGPGSPGPSSTEVTVGDVRPEQHAAVLDIAASSFRYSRFHLDPAIPTAIANRIKHDWILSYLRKQRGERLHVACLGGRPTGFLAVLASEAEGRTAKVIDLIGVDPAAQGRGVGRALVEFFVERYGDESDRLLVGTQVANTTSLRLYQRCGFTILRSAYVLHRHVGLPLR